MMIRILFFSLIIHSVGGKFLSLEDMHLKDDRKDSGFPVEVLKRSTGASAGVDGMIEGYDLSQLQPYTGLFSGEFHVSSSDGTTITDSRTNEALTVSIYRATYDDGSIVLAEKDERGNIVYVELRRPRGEPDMFLVPTSHDISDDEEILKDDSEFLAFTEDDVDYEGLQSQFHYAEVSSPEDPTRRLRKSKFYNEEEEPLIPNFEYRNGRESFAVSSSFYSSTFESALARGCESYRLVKLAVVFDADFCRMQGSFAASVRRIMTIVASASFHYERDMCVRLTLTDIFTPEDSCLSSSDSYFQDYNRHLPCGTGKSFLAKFSSMMKRNRKSLGLDKDATIHMFTGVRPPGGTIGCAYVGSFCNKAYTYGIEYMSFARNPHSQGVVLAHEIGHILNAPHLLTGTNSHVMEPNINNAAAGFSEFSVQYILTFLNSADITCDGFIQNSEALVPTQAPIEIPKPTEAPTESPTAEPSALPTPVPSPPPSPRPTISPFHQPALDDKCNIYQSSQQPACIFTSEEGRYSCFDSSSLLDASATNQCLFSVPLKRIQRCAGPLRAGRILDRNNAGTLETFEARSCSDACVVVSNFLCFRANGHEDVHSVSFDAFADFDVFGRFQTDVLVKENDGSSCSVAETECVSKS